MTAPKSIAAYGDCEEYFEKAASSEKGIAVTVNSPGMAVKFRQKMNAYRVLLRKQSRALHELNDPRHGTCPYDAYELSIDPEDESRVFIRKYQMSAVKVEELE